MQHGRCGTDTCLGDRRTRFEHRQRRCDRDLLFYELLYRFLGRGTVYIQIQKTCIAALRAFVRFFIRNKICARHEAVFEVIDPDFGGLFVGDGA